MRMHFKGSEYVLYERIIKPLEEGTFEGYVFGADTESCMANGRWEPQLLTFYNEQGGEAVWLPSGVCPFELLLHLVVQKYEDKLSTSKSPKDWPVIYGYFHNLEYDWGQLIKNNELLYGLSRYLRVIRKVDIEVGDFRVRLMRGLFKGNVTYVSIGVEYGGKCFKLELRDTFAFFPMSLAKLAKQLDLPEKMERPEDIGQVDYRSRPDDPEAATFVEYAIRDSEVTYLAARRIIEMHTHYGIGIPKVSASSYACTVMVRKLKKEMHTVIGTPALTQLALDAYYGGRFGGLIVGKCEHVNIFDINSSYPAALACLPSFTNKTGYFYKEDVPLKQALRYCRMFPCSFVEISGEDVDKHYPAINVRLKTGDLCPVYGRFEHIMTTGAELVAGHALGNLKNLVVHKVLAWYDDDPFFKELMYGLYEARRKSDKGSLEYITSKLVMNSIYGKLIESHSPLRLLWQDDVLVFIDGSKTPAQWGSLYYSLYVEGARQGIDPLRYICEYMERSRFKPDAKTVPLSTLPLTIQDFGYYAIPPLAAAVTGIARARLFMAMKISQAIYWDTDSVFTLQDAGTLQERLLAVPEEAYQQGVPRVQIGDSLGELKLEREDVDVYLAGIKRYWIDDSKFARHAMSLIPKELINEAIVKLVEEGEYRYNPNERPLSLLEAQSLDELGMFVKMSEFVVKRNLDYRMNWYRDGDIWRGEVKPYMQILEEVNKDDNQGAVVSRV